MAEAYLRAKFHLDLSNHLATVHERYRQDRQDRQRSDSIGRTVLQTVAQKWGLFRFDASVKTSSPLLDCRVNQWLVKFVRCIHIALTQLADVFDSMSADFFLHHRPDCVVH